MRNRLDARIEQLLMAGGDTRLLVGEHGLNKYGCSPLPREDALGFGSCTCSSPTSQAIDAAARVLERLQWAANPVGEAHLICGEIRGRIHELLGLPYGVDVALTPSGTDVELLALALAVVGGEQHVVNIVVGPSEVGSGTPQAAAGLHYDSLVPRGDQVSAGSPVNDELAARVCVKNVQVRNSNGDMLDEIEIDGEVTELVAQAVAQDCKVLLHVVAHSKTGMHAPTLACVERIKRNMSDEVEVVIDAAQGRFSRRGLREVLNQGFLVMFTGSKFYGGPPFSGALLIPSSLHPVRRGLARLPAGFEQYFTAAELPESWTSVREKLPNWCNYGAILRWTAALTEIEAYYRVPDADRLTILRAFEEAVPRIFGDSQCTKLLPVFPPLCDDATKRLLESKTTVFGFWVTPPGRAPLSVDELKVFHGQLNNDVAARYPESDSIDMSRKFHLGQPVHLGEGGSVLRVALGGEMVSRVATDTSLGRSIDDRVGWLRDQLLHMRHKIECLAFASSKIGSAEDARRANSLAE